MESCSGNAYVSLGKMQAYNNMRKKFDKNEELDMDGHKSSEEEVDSDDLKDDLNYSDEEINMQERKKRIKKGGKKYKQQVDTNVFTIYMSTLKQDQVELATGDPIFCQNCKSLFNSYSQIIQDDSQGIIGQKSSGDQIWKCEFCNHKNGINIEEEERPKSNEINYILESKQQIQNQQVLNDDQNIIFCIDISGSMCVTKPIEGKHKLKGDKVKELHRNFMKYSDGSDQYLEGEKKFTYISRLQCLQGAIELQLNELEKNFPNRKVGLVTFNNEVKVIGDGSVIEQTITGDKLNDFDFLLENGQAQAKDRIKCTIKDSKQLIKQKLMSLEETGPTALGPALLTSISLAQKQGSKVILCTDGLANVGLGSFDEIENDQQILEIEQFYQKVGEIAKQKGIQVSIISIQGEECNVDTLSKIAEVTGGQVDKVDPVNLTENFKNILEQEIIATKVEVTVKLHKGLQFRNEDQENLIEDNTTLKKWLGNVNEDTEMTFEYKMKTVKELVKMTEIDMNQIKKLPFQAQISYYSISGDKCIRAISMVVDISNDKEKQKKEGDHKMMSRHCIQKCSNMARKGQKKEALAQAKMYKRQMRDNINNEDQIDSYQQYNKHFGNIYNKINKEEDEMSDNEEEQKKDQKKQYVGKMSDSQCVELYKGQQMNKKDFMK